jgi:2-hydroxychromene-2-carboxylate isomerase
MRVIVQTVCPFAYIASKKLGRLAADTGLPVIWKPVLLGAIYKATAAPQGKDGSATDVMPASKRALTGLDLLR